MIRRIVLTALAGLLLTACGAAPAPQPAAGGPTPTGRPQLHTPPAVGPRTMVVRDQDNGHAVSLRVGDRLLVVLGSTYWQVDGSSDAAVLRQAAGPAVSPQPSGCVPGGGCGTVSETFDAVTAGSANVSARRTTCGEALACGPSNSLYRVTVMVAGG